MASLHVDATQVEDVITETESTTNEPQVVAPKPPPPPEMVKTVDADHDHDEEDPEELTVPPYEEKIENTDYEEDRDIEYSPFTDGGDAQPIWYAAGEPANLGDFNEDDDKVDDEDDF